MADLPSVERPLGKKLPSRLPRHAPVLWVTASLVDETSEWSKVEGTMQGDEKVIEQLNSALSSELTAIVQYMTQSEMCHNWGYKRLGELTKARAIEEMRHAEGLIERIIFLDGVPSINVGLEPQLGSKVQEQMEIDLKDEQNAVRQYNDAAKVCATAGDGGSKALFDSMIGDEERHADFLEAQLHAIKEIGVATYLAQQLGDGK
ncbi:MAG TPA: bacterioferritin [Terriglobales bacterium]|nr:bacterioferritin [Terriglobales bacterium]